MQIPLCDLKLQYQQLKDEIRNAVLQVLESQHFILGPKVAALEAEITRYNNVKYAVGVSSGTDALLVSLMALDTRPGDKIITTAYSFFATAGVISRLGAVPVFADICPRTYNINPDKMKEILQKNKGPFKAVIPVHLFGQCAEMEPILELAEKYNLRVIEDAAQALGARYKNKPAGSIGDLGCFSFYPTKNLGGIGDGGMVVTNNPDLAEKVKLLRGHGAPDKYRHKLIGGNFRLDEIQAAVLLVKLNYLNTWSEKRRENALTYHKLFKESGLTEKVILPFVEESNYHIYNQYIIRVSQRDKLQQFLKEKGICTEIYYPVPFHLQECFASLGYQPGDFPESEKAAKETLALPIYPELIPTQKDFVISKIGEFLHK